MKKININLQENEKCPIDNSYPTCDICNKEAREVVSINLNATKTDVLASISVCKDCASVLARKITEVTTEKNTKEEENKSNRIYLRKSAPMSIETNDAKAICSQYTKQLSKKGLIALLDKVYEGLDENSSICSVVTTKSNNGTLSQSIIFSTIL